MGIPTLNHTEHDAFLDILEDRVRDTSGRAGSLGLVVVNIERLGSLTAFLGYDVRFALLDRFARRLQECARPQDVIVRLGEGRFAVILPRILNEAHAILAANKFLRMSEDSFDVLGNRLTTHILMGISVCPEHGRKPEQLLQKAELALEDARNTKEPYALYRNDVDGRRAASWGLEAEIQDAIENGEFELFYQPKVSTSDRVPNGAEALMRWNHPTRGLITPDVFISLADRTGQIHALTKFAINTALRQTLDWPSRWGALSVSVNVTPNIVQDPDVVHMVSDALSIWGTDSSRLVLEVTEDALMQDPKIVFTTLQRLKEIGIGISIDDFGTGYSSLAYFKDIPADELKIDKSFVFKMLEDPVDRRIVETIISLAHGFDLSVVAEGVENEQILDALDAMKCDCAQGYFLSKPIPQTAFIDWLESYKTA